MKNHTILAHRPQHVHCPKVIIAHNLQDYGLTSEWPFTTLLSIQKILGVIKYKYDVYRQFWLTQRQTLLELYSVSYKAVVGTQISGLPYLQVPVNPRYIAIA